MYNSKLFAILPDYIVTPDGMEVDRHGNLVLSCPNFADDSVPGVVVRFDKDRNISKWFEVPVHPEIGVARNMGICFDEDYNIYIVDNPGWKADRPDWANKGRILKVTVDDDGNILSWKTIATGMEHPNGIKYHNGYLYVTESSMTPVKDPSGKLVSGIYRFSPDEENIEITNTLEDKNLIDWYITNDPDCQYGLDGIVFDAEGNLFVGNFGDGEIWKIEDSIFPFLLRAVLIDQLKSAFDWVKSHYEIINRISGILLVVIGLAMASGMLGKLLALLS